MADKKIIWIVVFLLMFSLVAAQELEVKTVDGQNISGNVEKVSDGYARPSDNVMVTSENWFDKLINFIKGLLRLQAITPQDFGVSIRASDGVPIGNVAKIGESPPKLGPSLLSASVDSLTKTHVDYYEISTGQVVSRDVYYGAIFDFRTETYGGSKTSLVSEGVPHIKSDPSGYVTIDESKGIATWHPSGVGHPDSDWFVTRYDIYIDRAGFGVEFADARNMAVMSDQKLRVPLKFTNNIVDGIGCGAEVKVKRQGFYLQDEVFLMPWSKCKLGVDDLTLELDRKELGTYEIYIRALLQNPSYTQFSTFGRARGCYIERGESECGYVVGNQTVIDDIQVLKKMEIVSQSVVDGMSDTSEVFRTIQ